MDSKNIGETRRKDIENTPLFWNILSFKYFRKEIGNEINAKEMITASSCAAV